MTYITKKLSQKEQYSEQYFILNKKFKKIKYKYPENTTNKILRKIPNNENFNYDRRKNTEHIKYQN